MGARAGNGTSDEVGLAKIVHFFGNDSWERLVTGQTNFIRDGAARGLIPNVTRVKAGLAPAE
jgi:hypothetical protein